MTKRKRTKRPEVIDVEAEPVIGSSPPPSSPPIVVEVKASPESPVVRDAPGSFVPVTIRGIDVRATIATARDVVAVGERIGELVAAAWSFFNEPVAPRASSRKPRAKSRRSSPRKR